MALAVLRENIRFGDINDGRVGTPPPHLHSMARKERSEEPTGTCGNAEQLLRSVDVLPGHASAIQATRGDGFGMLEGASSKQLWQGSQHSRRACSSRHVPGSTGKQDSNDGAGLLELFHFSEHVFQRLWSKLDPYRSAKCDGANTLPKWQREPTTGFAMLASDEGDPFAKERPVGRQRRSERFQAGSNSSRRDCQTGTA